jgi:hypothetical protein
MRLDRHRLGWIDGPDFGDEAIAPTDGSANVLTSLLTKV